MREMLTEIERWTKLFDAWKPDLLIANEDIPVAGIARARGIPVLAIVSELSSSIDRDYRYWAHSHLALLSPAQTASAALALPASARAPPTAIPTVASSARTHGSLNRLRFTR